MGYDKKTLIFENVVFIVLIYTPITVVKQNIFNVGRSDYFTHIP